MRVFRDARGLRPELAEALKVWGMERRTLEDRYGLLRSDR